MRSRTTAVALLAVTIAVAGCDSSDGGTPTPSTPSTPTAAATAMLASNVDVVVRPPASSMTAQQRQILAAYSEFITAHYRFYLGLTRFDGQGRCEVVRLPARP
jgi:type IV pilus biogenesis protein CpaD/CtpE